MKLRLYFLSILVFWTNTSTCSNLCHKTTSLFFKQQVCKAEHLFQNLNNWPFPTSFLLTKTFPIDKQYKNFVRKVNNAVFSAVAPIPLNSKLELVAYSHDALNNILDLSSSVAQKQLFVDFVAGSYLPIRSNPLSHRYGGHQFGYWAGQLGDGRAVLLGEYVNMRGERWELQLKGSGKTPYSRQGDGRAVLRSSIREFLCSEAMHHLGIPTSRALGIIVSDDDVIRDKFYDGHPQVERAAVVLRSAKSWFRIGSLEILEKSGETDLLRKLTDFIIENYFPSIDKQDEDKYVDFYWNVVNQTAVLMALWQSVGFTHGVCNTDNFSLLSITIDYGPFGFMDEYNPKFVPNTSDDEGRYSYERQPEVAIFNLEKLKIALLPLVSRHKQSFLDDILKQFSVIYKTKFMDLFRKKLGIEGNMGEEDENLVAILLKMMEETNSDFTTTFRNLGDVNLEDLLKMKIHKKYWAIKSLKDHKWFHNWVQMYVKRQKQQNTSSAHRRKIMNNVNPKYILRNWIAQQAIEKAENNDFSEVKKLLKIFENPYVSQLEAKRLKYSSKPPSWSKNLKVSCSS